MRHWWDKNKDVYYALGHALVEPQGCTIVIMFVLVSESFCEKAVCFFSAITEIRSLWAAKGREEACNFGAIKVIIIDVVPLLGINIYVTHI